MTSEAEPVTVWTVARCEYEDSSAQAVFIDRDAACDHCRDLNAGTPGGFEVAPLTLYPAGAHPYRHTVWTGWASVSVSGGTGPQVTSATWWDYERVPALPAPDVEVREYAHGGAASISVEGNDEKAVRAALLDAYTAAVARIRGALHPADPCTAQAPAPPSQPVGGSVSVPGTSPDVYWRLVQAAQAHHRQRYGGGLTY